jgi:pyrroloquinoline quinone biosynthesis protein B
MLVRVLGSAAGGGFPQWNCSCQNCIRVRNKEIPFQGTARSQAQLAISADSSVWFLVNASPDLRYQIEAYPPLIPGSSAARDTPINGVVLTCAEIDAALGLLLLRESQPLNVYATAGVRKLLVEDNSLFGVLRRQPDQVRWHDAIPDRSFSLDSIQGNPSGISCTPFSTDGAFPGHVTQERSRELDGRDSVVGLFIEHGGKRLAFFPGVQSITPELLERFEACDVLLFDGTFWSNDELIRIQGEGKTAREMGHLPVGDADGSLRQLTSLTGPRKIFIHINNTNPMLDEASDEYRRVLDAGWELAVDGMEIEL